jgi:DNA repair protein RadC
MNLQNLVGAKAADKIQQSGINILQACEMEIQYIAGKAAAKKITAAKEMLNIVHDKLQIKSSIDIYEIVKDMQFLDHERFEVLALNRNNKVIERILISQGGTFSTVVDLKILFKRILICGASSFICVHNHPSGNKDASQADIDLTRKITAAANVLDLKLLDHIIVAGNNYTSFADNGMM